MTKGKKIGSVLLLVLFLLAFITSIIGLMYSYNKRILLISKQERKNLAAYRQFTESLLNIYFAEKFKINIDGTEIAGFSEGKPLEGTQTGSITFTWVSPNPNDSLGLTGLNFADPPTSLNISTTAGGETVEIDYPKSLRDQYAKDIIPSIKTSLKDFLDKIFYDVEKQIEGPIESLNPKDEKNYELTLTYKIIVKKLGKQGYLINKEIEVTFKYDINVTFIFEAEAHVNEDREVRSIPPPPQENNPNQESNPQNESQNDNPTYYEISQSVSYVISKKVTTAATLAQISWEAK
ncbi:MAG: hypothetical protein ACK4GR_01630 [bacterium]